MLDRLFIATPAYQGQVAANYTQCALGTQYALANAGVTHRFQFHQGAGSPQISRGILTAQFMASGYSHLLFIDADIEWHPNSILRLGSASNHHEVCCAVYPKKTLPLQFPVNFVTGSEHTAEWHPATGYLEIKDAPTGFLLIRREVIERMIAAYPERKCSFRPPHEIPEGEPQWEYDLFTQFIDTDGMFLSEDFGFSRLWQRIGGRIWADPDISLAHHGHHRYSGKLADLMVTDGQR